MLDAVGRAREHPDGQNAGYLQSGDGEDPIGPSRLGHPPKVGALDLARKVEPCRRTG